MPLVFSTDPGYKLSAVETNATNRPSALIDGAKLKEFACTPLDETLTRVVVPACVSRTKTSGWPFVSFGTRFVANEVNAMYRPLAVTAFMPKLKGLAAVPLGPLPCAPLLERLTIWVGSVGGRSTVSMMGRVDVVKPSWFVPETTIE
jgi:hypothetical protein